VGACCHGHADGRPLMVIGLEPVAWVVAIIAGAGMMLSARAPSLGSRLGWVYPAVMTVTSVAVLVVDGAWWLTRSDPRVAAVAGVAGLWLWLSARERVRVLKRRRDDLVAVGRKRVLDSRARG
jgi:hypothetical protein